MKCKNILTIFLWVSLFLSFSMLQVNVLGSDGTSALSGESPQEKIPKRIIGKDGTPMVLIPAGEFQMGGDMDEANEKPVHTVYLDAFYMDIYEVANVQYQKFLAATGTGRDPRGYWSQRRSGYDHPNQPAVGITWQRAVDYCQWAGKRLPTEAEWEKAARGGLEGKKYSWGDEPADETMANFGKYITGYSTPVGSYPPNGYGLHDMAGNVEEWCYDWYRPDYYQNSPQRNPKGPDSGFHGERVVRGGTWQSIPMWIRCAARSGAAPKPKPRDFPYNSGFRCAKSVSD